LIFAFRSLRGKQKIKQNLCVLRAFAVKLRFIMSPLLGVVID